MLSQIICPTHHRKTANNSEINIESEVKREQLEVEEEDGLQEEDIEDIEMEPEDDADSEWQTKLQDQGIKCIL